jgi:hypothetical protein
MANRANALNETHKAALVLWYSFLVCSVDSIGRLWRISSSISLAQIVGLLEIAVNSDRFSLSLITHLSDEDGYFGG